MTEATAERRRRGIFRRRPGDAPPSEVSGVWYPRWFWPAWAAPATLWLLVLFVLPFYVVLSVAFGTVDFFRNPLPVWEPWYWTANNVTSVYHKIFGANAFL